MSEPTFEATAPVDEPIAPTSFRGAAPRKQSFNVYTVMLIISFICLLAGTLLLLRELSNYGGVGESPWKTGDAQPRVSYVVDMAGQFRG
ncbi:MAG: hypothetical protein ACR2NP_16580 [Pirellulaceae bacterium]